jgi:hypothetical protein
MDITFRTGGQKVIIESKTGCSKRIHTPFHFRCAGRIPKTHYDNIDGQAWYPDTYQEVNERSELRF